MQNEMIAKVRSEWNSRKSEIEQAWKDAADGIKKTRSKKVLDVTLWS